MSWNSTIQETKKELEELLKSYSDIEDILTSESYVDSSEIESKLTNLRKVKRKVENRSTGIDLSRMKKDIEEDMNSRFGLHGKFISELKRNNTKVAVNKIDKKSASIKITIGGYSIDNVLRTNGNKLVLDMDNKLLKHVEELHRMLIKTKDFIKYNTEGLILLSDQCRLDLVVEE